MVVSPRKFGIVDLKEGGFETLLGRSSGFCPAADETITQGGQGGWRNETVDWVQVRIFNLTDALR
jgi:ribosome modulation factor